MRLTGEAKTRFSSCYNTCSLFTFTGFLHKNSQCYQSPTREGIKPGTKSGTKFCRPNMGTKLPAGMAGNVNFTGFPCASDLGVKDLCQRQDLMEKTNIINSSIFSPFGNGDNGTWGIFGFTVIPRRFARYPKIRNFI